MTKKIFSVYFFTLKSFLSKTKYHFFIIWKKIEYIFYVGFPSFAEGVAFLIQLTSDPPPRLLYWSSIFSKFIVGIICLKTISRAVRMNSEIFVLLIVWRGAGGQIEAGVIICSLWLVRRTQYLWRNCHNNSGIRSIALLLCCWHDTIQHHILWLSSMGEIG